MKPIPAVAEAMRSRIQKEIDEKTKPLGSLGVLEDIALQLALIQDTLKPAIERPTVIIMAGDHGIAAAGVSPYPQSVTSAMVQNFAAGGAAISVFTKQLGLQLELIDCGTLNTDEVEGVLSLHIAAGTANFLEAEAMSDTQLKACREAGEARIQLHATLGCNTIGFGEMGIGNTSSAALLIHCLSDLSLETCVNRGAGCDDAQLARKLNTLHKALAFHGRIADPLRALRVYGGFEIATMSFAMLEAARNQMLVVVDGFIASSAALVALRLDPAIKPYLIFAHQSQVQGHGELLKSLGVRALLQLELRLGEGTGVALCMPLIQCAAAMLSDMATFESASVEKRIEA